MMLNNLNIKKGFVAALLLSCGVMCAHAQNTPTAEEQAKYTQTITERADKELNVLNLTDSAKYKRLEKILVDQSRFINDTHDARNAQVAAINEAKKQPGADKAALNAKIAAIDTDMVHRVKKQHAEFLAKLGKDLNADQIDKVKDAITYRILEVTYNSYIDEVPELTDAQKLKIKNWLTEARELAIDGESSKAKHAPFEKYKGRINNYLSAQGYDMKKEGEEWAKRNELKKEQQTKKDN